MSARERSELVSVREKSVKLLFQEILAGEGVSREKFLALVPVWSGISTDVKLRALREMVGRRLSTEGKVRLVESAIARSNAHQHKHLAVDMIASLEGNIEGSRLKEQAAAQSAKAAKKAKEDAAAAGVPYVEAPSPSPSNSVRSAWTGSPSSSPYGNRRRLNANSPRHRKQDESERSTTVERVLQRCLVRQMRKAATEGASDWNPNFDRGQTKAAVKKGGEQMRRRSVTMLASKHQHLEQGAPHGPPSRAQWDFVKQRLAWLTPREKDPAKLARETFQAALHLLVCEEVDSLHELQEEKIASRGELGSAPSSPTHGDRGGFSQLLDLSESDCNFDAIRALVTGLQEMGAAGRFLQNIVQMLSEDERVYFTNLLETAARRKKMTIGLNTNKSLLGVKVDALDAEEKVMLLQSLATSMSPKERQQLVMRIRSFERDQGVSTR
jgi:hypothetical protein